LQIPLRTLSSAEAYIANQEWRDARLRAYPLHPSGGCSFARHGYARLKPQGIRIARWYCPEGDRTFSLLSDFLAEGFQACSPRSMTASPPRSRPRAWRQLLTHCAAWM
jgi:hypothetical protein